MFLKRLFDIILSLFLILLLSPVMVITYLFASIDTQSNGIFCQKRIGQYGKPFTIYKLKTIHPITRKISAVGKFFRLYKIDELPQLFNILLGNMSFVGPRPDIQGYYDTLEGENRKILELKPGITSLAAIKYADEEELLSRQDDPLRYNDEMIFPDKVMMNLTYYYQRSLITDIKIMAKTLISVFYKPEKFHNN